jgi:tRNA (cytidine32/uridine32-2'-O)-methyltransferase
MLTTIEQNIRIVLVNPSHPGNIGAIARAMKTMGLTQLYLVQPKRFPDKQAVVMASHADDILEKAVVVETLSEAIGDCRLVFGTSNRVREISWKVFDPQQAAQQITTQAQSAPIAILFGREDSGLTNEEIQQCHYQIIIPANPNYNSLNIAAAVQIICYEIFQAGLGKNNLDIPLPDEYASHQELENLYEHLNKVLWDVEFLKSTRSSHIPNRLRRLFNRAQPEKKEVKILRGILTAIEKKIK